MTADAQKWKDMSAYDVATADAMLDSGRYLYVLFCSQQAVEKALKAQIVDRTQTFPPRTHDLIRLAGAAGVTLSDEWDRSLRSLTKFYLGTRYPEEVSELARDATREFASSAINRAKEFLKWLEQ